MSDEVEFIILIRDNRPILYMVHKINYNKSHTHLKNIETKKVHDRTTKIFYLEIKFLRLVVIFFLWKYQNLIS